MSQNDLVLSHSGLVVRRERGKGRWALGERVCWSWVKQEEAMRDEDEGVKGG